MQLEVKERPKARIKSPKPTDQRMSNTESRMIRYMGDSRVQNNRMEVRRMWRRVAEAWKLSYVSLKCKIVGGEVISQ